MRLAGLQVTTALQHTFVLFEVSAQDPIAKPEFFKNMIGILHGWTNLIDHSCSPRYFDTILLTGLIAGGTCVEKGRQASYFSSAHLQISKTVLDQKKLATPGRSLRSSQVAYRPDL